MKKNFVLLTSLVMFSFTYAQPDYAAQRASMVENQLVARGISDSVVLAVMGKVPREEFVPQPAKPYAYYDGALDIGKGQTISQPYIVAFMTEELDLEPTDKVLEIGTGSGYQAAVLAEIAEQVYTIEIVEYLGKTAMATLERLNYSNVNVRIGDGYAGWPEQAPFNAIVVTAAVKEIPQPLLDQLAEGGRMIIPVKTKFRGEQLVLVTKKNGKIKKRNRMPVRFVPFTRKKN